MQHSKNYKFYLKDDSRIVEKLQFLCGHLSQHSTIHLNVLISAQMKDGKEHTRLANVTRLTQMALPEISLKHPSPKCKKNCN